MLLCFMVVLTFSGVWLNNMSSVFAVTGCVDSDVLDEFDFQSEYLEWEDLAPMSEIQQDDDDDDVSIDIFPIFSE